MCAYLNLYFSCPTDTIFKSLIEYIESTEKKNEVKTEIIKPPNV